MRCLFSLLLMTALAGCMSMTAAPGRTVKYQCDQGREFSVTYPSSGDSLSIDISRMQFSLDADPSPGDGERYSCSLLTLWKKGESLRVEMEGAGLYENCRERP